MIFKRNPDIYKNAYLNWQKTFRTFDEHFVLYSRQFKESADRLIDSIGENHGHIADTVIIPAIFLYRHSIELALKGILHKIYLDAGIDIEKMKEKLNGHGLESLWSKIINELTRNYSSFNDQKNKNELKKIGKLIMDMHSIDDSSMTFRYPFDIELQGNTYGDGKESFGIDYLHLKEEIDYLHSRLDYWIYEYISNKEEE